MGKNTDNQTIKVGDLVTQRELKSWQRPNYLRVTRINGIYFNAKPDGDERSKFGGSYLGCEWQIVNDNVQPNKPLDETTLNQVTS